MQGCEGQVSKGAGGSRRSINCGRAACDNRAALREEAPVPDLLDHDIRLDVLARREEVRVTRATGITISPLGNHVILSVAKSAPLCPMAREFVAGWLRQTAAAVPDTDDASPCLSVLVRHRGPVQLHEGTHYLTAQAARHLADQLDPSKPSTPRRLSQANLDAIHERLLRKTRRSGKCLLWTGAVQKSGGGVTGAGGKQHLASRVAAFLWIGGFHLDDPDIMVKRTCRNARCVEPEHLEVCRVVRAAG